MIWVAIINEVSSNWQIIIISDIFLLNGKNGRPPLKLCIFQ